MLKLTRTVWTAILAAVVLAAGFGAAKCYGNRRYERGLGDAQVARLDSAHKTNVRSLDSLRKAMQPVVDSITKESDSLRKISRSSRIVAASALRRAERAEEALKTVDDSLLEVTPPEVRLLIDRLSTSHDSLKVNLERMIGQNRALDDANLKLAEEARNAVALYDKAREQITADEQEIAILKKQKTPKRVGFKTGFVAGVAAAVVAGVAVAALAH